MSNFRIINVLPVEVQERLKKGEKLNIIDVREADEVASGKIPGAKHISLGEIPYRIQEINPNAETIMVCRSGGRSLRACEFLISRGFQNVKNMSGGMNAWRGSIVRK